MTVGEAHPDDRFHPPTRDDPYWRGGDLEATGQWLNRLGVHLNPDPFTWNCLTDWQFDGARGYGEDHDNWSAPAARSFFRAELGHPDRTEGEPRG